MLHSIQKLEHYIRTTFGDLEKALGPSGDLLPSQGSRQGNDTSGDSWTAISAVLLNILRKDG